MAPFGQRRQVIVGMGALALVAAALLSTATGAAAAPQAAGGAATTVLSTATSRTPESKPGEQVVLYAGAALATPTFVGAEAGVRADGTSASPSRVTFAVSYSGFSAEAQAAFQRAVNIWAGQLTSSVPITVSATFTPLGTNVLGSAGPSSVWRDFSGAPAAGTWYVDSVANKRHGSQLDASPDIVARFNSSFSGWWFGSGPAPAGSYDFTTVVLHELGHGLGFLGAGTVSGSSGSVRLQGFPIAYDRFTERGSGKAMLSYPDGSTALGTALRSNNVFFDSPAVRSANGNKPAKLYAPATWQQGSSYSHLDETVFKPGTANALMTPILNGGETVRQPGGIAKAVLTTVGW